MSLANQLTEAGTPPERLDVRCTIVMDEVEDQDLDHRIVSSTIVARASVPAATEESFARAAQAADEGCPLSALIKATATVSIEATLL